MTTDDPRWTVDAHTGCWIWSGRIDNAAGIVGPRGAQPTAVSR